MNRKKTLYNNNIVYTCILLMTPTMCLYVYDCVYTVFTYLWGSGECQNSCFGIEARARICIYTRIYIHIHIHVCIASLLAPSHSNIDFRICVWIVSTEFENWKPYKCIFCAICTMHTCGYIIIIYILVKCSLVFFSFLLL